MTFEITSLLNNIIRQKGKNNVFLYTFMQQIVQVYSTDASYFPKIFLLPLDRLKKRDYINYIDIVNFSNG